MRVILAEIVHSGFGNAEKDRLFLEPATLHDTFCEVRLDWKAGSPGPE